MGSEVECKAWLPGALKTSVDSGSMLGVGEGLEVSDSEPGKGCRSCTWDVIVGGAPANVCSGRRLGLTLGCGVGEGNSVSRDFVGVTGVEER